MSIGIVVLALSMGLDVFAGGLSLGVAHLPRPRWTQTALLYAGLGTALLAAGYYGGRLLSDGFGSVVAYLAGGALILLGLRTLGDLVIGKPEPDEDLLLLEPDALAPRAILLTGLACSADKLAVGITLSLVEDLSFGPLLVYIAVQGFAAAWGGIALGVRLGAQLGKAAHVLAGVVFVGLGTFIVLQTALGGKSL